jgi:hypothetical protein
MKKINKTKCIRNKTSRNKTSRNKTSRNKTSRNKTSRNKTPRNKTSRNKTLCNKKRKIKKKYKWIGGGRLEKGIKKDYDLFEININNDKSIYQIRYDDDCKQYFYLPKNNEYILLFVKEENRYILFNTKVDNDDIEEEIYTKCLNLINASSNSYYVIFSRLKSLNILVIQKKCVENISEDKLYAAKEEINKLNILLKEKCSNLSLNLDYVYNLKGNVELYSESYLKDLNLLVLCLYNKNNCISSIELILENDNNIVINSKTNQAFEGKKYNKLLRGVVIIILSLIPNINKLVSYAGNIISAWLLIHYYNASIPPEIDENIKFYEFLEKKEDKTLSKQLLEEFNYSSDNIFGLVLHIDINENNVEKAYKEVYNLLDSGIDSAKQIQCV